MRASILLAGKKILIVVSVTVICPLLYGFAAFMNEQEWTAWGNRFLNENYDASVEPKLKKFEISLTSDHFIRLRKTYQQGKQEYFSFKITRFNSLDYKTGPANTDTLEITTLTDDIIYQTFEDPKGDIDSMATQWDIPVKKVPLQQVDSLKQALSYLKEKGQ